MHVYVQAWLDLYQIKINIKANYIWGHIERLMCGVALCISES
jgi:hypothetical protein